MKRLALILLLVTGCSRQGAVRVIVHFEDFEPGCLEVSAVDSKSGTADALQLGTEKLTGGTSVMVGIAPKPGWSSKLQLHVRSFERACEGTPVEELSTEVTLQAGSVEEWDVTLTARDGDRDGYAAASNGVHGGDCDDTSALRHPGAEEECGTIDTNCNGLIACLDPLCAGHVCDDGVASTTLDICTASGVCAGRNPSDCPPGTWVTQLPTGTTDRVCTPCPSGTFSSSLNATNCTPWNDCIAGQRVMAPPSAVADRACVLCEVGTFSTMPNSSACAPVGTCAPGTAQDGPLSMTSPIQCSACMPGNYCAGGIAGAVPCANGFWDHDANPASVCVPWTQCAPGFAATTLGTTTTDLVCTACVKGTYCPGQMTPPIPCGFGTWDHDADTTTVCASWTPCALGSAVTTPGTAIADTVCSVCAAGNYCAGGLDPAVACASGTWDSDASATTACVAWADCAAGSSITTPGTTTTNRVCGPCATGSFSTMTNAPSCTTYTACTAGQYVSTAGTSTTDQSCSPCNTGFFTATQNQTSCAPWTTCTTDTYESAAPSLSSDRVCSNYRSCLDRFTRVPSTPSGSYVIDPDGPGGTAPFSIGCDMVTDGGGWTIISFEDFSTAATGWSDTRRDTTSSCYSDWGAMLGGYNIFANGATSSKTYNFLGITHSNVRVSLDYFVIDSWDGEEARVTVDGTYIFKTAFTMGGSNTCGGVFADRGLRAVVGTPAHTTNTATLTVTSTLDQSATDESFGVDNVSVMIR